MNKNKMIIIIASLFVLATLAACGAVPAGSADKANPRTISVSGHGQVYLVPDVAYVYIGVQTRSASVADALNQNTAQAQKVSDSLKELGVDQKDIQTTSFNIYPQQEFDQQGQVTKTTYVVDNTVYVTVRDLTKLGQMLDVVVRSGANSINGISFDVLDKTKAMSDARKMAVDSARQQAEELAAVTNVKLGPIQTINVYSNNTPVPIAENKGGGAMMQSTGQVPVSAGQLVLTADASLVYEIQ